MVVESLRFRSESPLTDLSSDEEVDHADSRREASVRVGSTAREPSVWIVDDFTKMSRQATGNNDLDATGNCVPDTAGGNNQVISARSTSATSDAEMQLRDLDSDPPMRDSTSISDEVLVISGLQRPSTQTTRRQQFITTKGWSLEGLLDSGKNFVEVKRVSASASPGEVAKAIRLFEDEGEPLIISGCHELELWPKGDSFSADWLIKYAPRSISARNCTNWQDTDMSMKDFIQLSRSTPPFMEKDDAKRYYGKDVSCPNEWISWLNKSGIPSDVLPYGSNDFMKYVPENERPETLMCYVGVGDTFTPAHKDLCASSGQNIMVHTENDGSSFWFMTKDSDAPKAADFLKRQLGHEWDEESHLIQVETFAKAPFTIYVAQQKLGDLMLVPKRSVHQVVNAGGITIKASWSRMTLTGLGTALGHELHVYRRLCRKETYRIKATCYYSMQKLHERLNELTRKDEVISKSSSSGSSRRPTLTNKAQVIVSSLSTLINLFDIILKEEFCGTLDPAIRTMSQSEDIIGMTCDYCAADIFQSFMECKACAVSETDRSGSPVEDTIIICPGCYAEGRSCRCSHMTPSQCRTIESLFEVRNHAAKCINSIPGRKFFDKFTPISAQILRPMKNPALFEAAYFIWGSKSSTINIKLPTRRCSRPSEQGHTVPSYGIIPCKQCHRGRCFRCLLQGGVYVTDAITELKKDLSRHKEWHEFHKECTRKRDTIYQSAEVAHISGLLNTREANFSPMLVAAKYTLARSRNPEKTKCGWYDEDFILSLPSEPDEEERVDSDDSDNVYYRPRRRRIRKMVRSPSVRSATVPSSGSDYATKSLVTDKILFSRKSVYVEVPRVTQKMMDMFKTKVLKDRMIDESSGWATRKITAADGQEYLVGPPRKKARRLSTQQLSLGSGSSILLTKEGPHLTPSKVNSITMHSTSLNKSPSSSKMRAIRLPSRSQALTPRFTAKRSGIVKLSVTSSSSSRISVSKNAPTSLADAIMASWGPRRVIVPPGSRSSSSIVPNRAAPSKDVPVHEVIDVDAPSPSTSIFSQSPPDNPSETQSPPAVDTSILPSIPTTPPETNISEVTGVSNSDVPITAPSNQATPTSETTLPPPQITNRQTTYNVSIQPETRPAPTNLFLSSPNSSQKHNKRGIQSEVVDVREARRASSSNIPFHAPHFDNSDTRTQGVKLPSLSSGSLDRVVSHMLRNSGAEVVLTVLHSEEFRSQLLPRLLEPIKSELQRDIEVKTAKATEPYKHHLTRLAETVKDRDYRISELEKELNDQRRSVAELQNSQNGSKTGTVINNYPISHIMAGPGTPNRSGPMDIRHSLDSTPMVPSPHRRPYAGPLGNRSNRNVSGPYARTRYSENGNRFDPYLHQKKGPICPQSGSRPQRNEPSHGPRQYNEHNVRVNGNYSGPQRYTEDTHSQSGTSSARGRERLSYSRPDPIPPRPTLSRGYGSDVSTVVAPASPLPHREASEHDRNQVTTPPDTQVASFNGFCPATPVSRPVCGDREDRESSIGDGLDDYDSPRTRTPSPRLCPTSTSTSKSNVTQLEIPPLLMLDEPNIGEDYRHATKTAVFHGPPNMSNPWAM